MISTLQIRFYVFEREPSGFESPASIQRRLIHIMRTLWIAARAENVDGKAAHFGGKFNHADIRSASRAVAFFLTLRGSRIESKDRAVAAPKARNRYGGAVVLKSFVCAFVQPLQAIKFAPRDSP